MVILVLCPSRGRPERAREAWESFENTKTTAAEMHFVIDSDDPALPVYRELVPTIEVQPSGRRGMTDPLNAVVSQVWDDWDMIGFVGDDHRFRTNGWDKLFETHLASVGGGLAYAFDGYWQNGEIPTQIFGSSVIWRALGWMALPTARHLYLDNAWRVIGEGLDRFFYFPGILIEHMHPLFGKAEWDEQYRSLNAPDLYSEDGVAFNEWISSGQAERDVERVRDAL